MNDAKRSPRPPLPVEPLSDEAWTRVERAVMRDAAPQLGAGHGRLRVGRAWPWAVAVAAAAVALWFAVRKPSEHAPSTIAGIETVARVSAEDGATTLALGDATLVVTPGTELAVTRPGTGVRVALTAGSVDLTVAKRGGRAPLVVAAGDVEVIVVGTAFTVEIDDSGEVAVVVREGLVEVAHAGMRTPVAAHHAWRRSERQVARVATAGGPGVPGVTATPPASRFHTDGDVPVPGLDDRQAVVPIAPGNATDRPTENTNDDRSRARTDGGPGTTARDRATSPPTTTSGRPAGRGSLLDEIAAAAIAPFAQVDGSLSERVAHFQAASLTGDAASRSAAMYGLAVSLSNAGKPRDALAVLDGYRNRFPRGAELASVLWLRVRVHCGREVTSLCRQAANSYLWAFPDDRHAGLARRVIDTAVQP